MSLKTGVYYCHACHVRGTFVQFLRRMGAPVSMIDAALEIERRTPKEKRPAKKVSGVGEHFLNEGLLGVFQYCPTDLVEDGFDEKLLQELEIGFDQEQMRIIFPIRDLCGNLVGISGRTVLGEWPRYKVYKSDDLVKYAPDDPDTLARYRAYDIKNHNFLWNFHNVYPVAFFGDLDTVIIVEGYKACIWMIQNGIDNTVALQGSRMTWEQEALLSRLGVTIILFLDNNKAGKEGTYDTGRRLQSRGMNVQVVSYPSWCDEHAQPDNLQEPDILGVLDAATSWHRWRLRNHDVLREAEKQFRAKGQRLQHS
jgi:hypothetical protein